MGIQTGSTTVWVQLWVVSGPSQCALAHSAPMSDAGAQPAADSAAGGAVGTEFVAFASKKKNRGNLRKRNADDEGEVRVSRGVLRRPLCQMALLGVLAVVYGLQTHVQARSATTALSVVECSSMICAHSSKQGDDETNVNRAVKQKKESAIAATTKSDKAFKLFSFDGNRDRQEMTDNGATATKESETSFDRRDAPPLFNPHIIQCDPHVCLRTRTITHSDPHCVYTRRLLTPLANSALHRDGRAMREKVLQQAIEMGADGQEKDDGKYHGQLGYIDYRKGFRRASGGPTSCARCTKRPPSLVPVLRSSMLPKRRPA